MANLFRKQQTITPDASPAAPHVALEAPIAFAVLIPVLTATPVIWAFMVDMVDSRLGIPRRHGQGSPYGGLGTSRSGGIGSG